MGVRPRKRSLSRATVQAAMELGELNPLEKARQAIAGESGGRDEVKVPKSSYKSPGGRKSTPSRGAIGAPSRSGFAGRRKKPSRASRTRNGRRSY